MMDSLSKTAVCVCNVEDRLMGIESTEMDSNPPSSSSIDNQTWFGTFVAIEGRMRGLI